MTRSQPGIEQRFHHTEVIASCSELLSLHCPQHPLLLALLPACAGSQVIMRQDFSAYAVEPWVSTLAVPSLLLNRAMMLAKLLRILTSRSLCHSSLWNCCILSMTLSNCLTTTGLPIIWPAELTEETNADCIQTSIRRMLDGSAAEAVACKSAAVLAPLGRRVGSPP